MSSNGSSPEKESSAAANRPRTPPRPINTARDQHNDQDNATDDDNTAAATSTSQASAGPSLLAGAGSLRAKKTRPHTLLQSRVTTSVSLTDVDMTGEMDKSPAPSIAQSRIPSRRPSFVGTPRHGFRADADDSASIRSTASRVPTFPQGDVESLFDATFRKGLGEIEELDSAEEEALELAQEEDQNFASQFESEFVELERLRESGNSEESMQLAWSLKLKHFLILSSAGKPIWSRHGDDQLITSTIGVIQTIISFYQDEDDDLKSFTAGDARFAVMSKGHLHLVAVSRMGENDAQLRAQLDALYMQILSTLTLPSLEKMFLQRPSTDLRRPLQGTESFLSALADGFTRGSPSTLLSSLESLRLRKAQRVAINNVLIKARGPSLLYGLLVTGSGQLISVLRPKKHSLHPGDLHLIFNMLFEAKGVRAGGGENWVPICLPGFNNQGYVYMYVSFLDINSALSEDPPARNATNEHDNTSTQPRDEANDTPPPGTGTPTSNSQHDKAHTTATDLAIILISTSRDAFFPLRDMRDAVVAHLRTSASLSTISAALLRSRPSLPSLLPGSPLRHFLYKSRPHVQFAHPGAHPYYSSPLAWRRLMRRYAALHAAVHGQTGRSKVVWSVERDAGGGGRGGDAVLGVAWVTAEFEVYAIAETRAGRAAVARGVCEVVQWAQREEERLFVVGGAVF